MHIALRINDPMEIYDEFVGFVIDVSRSVTIVDKLWGFIVSPLVFIKDHYLDNFLGDILTGKGIWSMLLDLIFGGR